MPIPSIVRAISILPALLIGLVASSPAGEIEAGVAEVEITPPKGCRMAGYYVERINTGTHDPLHAKALVLRQGEQQAALVFCDLVGVPLKVAQQARELASKATGIPDVNIAVAATHSHTGPLYYGMLRWHLHEKAVATFGRDPQEEFDFPSYLARRVAEAVVDARKGLAPVRIEAGCGRETRLAFNRRFHMKDGSVRFNPGPLNPDIVRPAGPIDPDVGILLIEPLMEDRPIAGLTVFAMHLDTVSGTEYSADYPYYLETALKRAFGPKFVSLFGTGPCGDINHLDVTKYEQAPTEAIGKQLAETVLGARANLTLIANPSLDVRHTRVTCDVQRPSAEEIAEARARAGQMTSAKLPFLERVKTAKVLDLHANYQGETRAVEVQAFRLGAELAIVTLPSEVFVELGLAIKQQSPFKTTMIVELTNDNTYYIPTQKAFSEGSYEVVNSRLAPGSGERLVEAAVKLLQKLEGPSK